jgi:hypothetical protein
MPADWRQWSTGDGLRLDGHTIEVTFPGGRRQRVHVEEQPAEGTLRLWSVAARPGIVRDLGDAWEYARQRNRGSHLVGYKVDLKLRLIGETYLPAATLVAEEWRFCVHLLASRCDRIEYLLSGRDEH